MRKIFVLLLFLVLSLGKAQAGELRYEVREGDNLSAIAREFGVSVQELARANWQVIPDLDKLEIGLQLVIPETSEKTYERDVFVYRRPNANPFTEKRDAKRLVSRFSCPEKVKQDFFEIIKDFQEGRNPGQVSFVSSKIGDISGFEEMGFGDYRLVHNVKVDFEDRQKSRVWKTAYGEYDYYLVLPKNCWNWAWYKVAKPEPVPDPKPIPVPEPKPEPAPEPDPEPKPKPSCLDWDSSLYAGSMRGAQSGNKKDRHKYFGGHASVFLYCNNFWDGRFRIGPSVNIITWEGEVDEAVDYSGDQKLFGLKAEYLRSNNNSSLFLYWGEKRGRIRGKDFPYKSREKADTLVVEVSHERWYSRRWFPLVEFGSRLNFSFNEEKRTYWDGNPIEDPALDQGEYSGRAKVSIYDHYTATPTFELTGGYREFDESLFLQPRAGIKWFGDLFAIEVSYLWIEHSQNNMMGAHIRFNLDEAFRRLW